MAKGEGILALLTGGGDDKEDAAQDVLDAIKDDDAKALSMALSRFYEACDAKRDE